MKKGVFKLPACKQCNGTGSIPYKDELYGMRTRSCPTCVMQKSRLNKLKRSRIPFNYIRFEWSDYKPNIIEKRDEKGNILVTDSNDIDWYCPDKKSTIKVSRSFVNNENVKKLKALVDKRHNHMNENGDDLFLYGNASCGKTLLASVILKDLILNHGYSGMFVSAEELVLKAYSQLGQSSIVENESFSFEELISTNFLVIDGFDRLSDMTLPTLTRLMVMDVIKKRKSKLGACIITSTHDYEYLMKKNQVISELTYTIKAFQFFGQYEKEARLLSAQKLVEGE